jgi:2-dehydropantoate 2-reductase
LSDSDQEKVMRSLIVGAGALGGYYGGMLLRGGADVTFLVRPRRAAILAEHGLVIRLPDGEFRTPVKTVSAGTIDGQYDVVFLACKAYDLAVAIDDFAPALSPEGAVLPVLNGINHIAVLSDRLGPGRVLGGVTQFLVNQTPDGDIVPTIHGTGATLFGELTGERTPRCEKILAALAAGGAGCTLSETILAEMWLKFCGAGASFAVAGLLQVRAREVASAPAGTSIVTTMYDECAGICTAEGYPPPDWLRDFFIQMWCKQDSDYSPSLQADIENSRPTEGDPVVGDLVRRADRLGLDAPTVRAAQCRLQIYEARRRALLAAA